ncbi:MAG: hypothetical protein GY915_08075 [bacterium]|nr:hypothetical protein [bacterium]
MIKHFWVFLFMVALPTSASFGTESAFEDPHSVALCNIQVGYENWEERFSDRSSPLGLEKSGKLVLFFNLIPFAPAEDLTSTPYVPTPEDLEDFDSVRFNWWRSQKSDCPTKGTVDDQIRNACRVLGNKIYTNRIDCAGRLHGAQQFYTQCYRLAKKVQEKHDFLLDAPGRSPLLTPLNNPLDEEVFSDLTRLQKEYFDIEKNFAVLMWESIVEGQMARALNRESEELGYIPAWDNWGNTEGNFGNIIEGIGQKWRNLYVNAMKNTLWSFTEELMAQGWTDKDVAATLLN